MANQEMDELVKRLRQAANGFFPASPLGDYGVCDEAASAIETLLKQQEEMLKHAHERALSLIDASEQAMIAKRKTEYGGLNGQQKDAIKLSHHNQKLGAQVMFDTLCASITESEVEDK